MARGLGADDGKSALHVTDVMEPSTEGDDLQLALAHQMDSRPIGVPLTAGSVARYPIGDRGRACNREAAQIARPGVLSRGRFVAK